MTHYEEQVYAKMAISNKQRNHKIAGKVMQLIFVTF